MPGLDSQYVSGKIVETPSDVGAKEQIVSVILHGNCN